MPCLLIKKKFMERIKNGTKTIEYRDITPYYTKIFNKKPNKIKLLCQHDSLVVSISKITKCYGKYALYLEII